MTTILLFLFIFNVPLKGLPVGTAAIVSFFLLAERLLRSKEFLIDARPVYTIGLFIVSLGGYYTFMTFLYGKNDFSFIHLIIKNLVIIPIGAYLLIERISQNKYALSPIAMFKTINYAFIIQGTIIIASLTVPQIREFFHALNAHEYFATVSARYGYFRALGFAYSVTYDLSVAFAISLFLLFYLWQHKQIGLFSGAFVLCIYFVSLAVSGRTGLVISTFLIGGSVIWYGRNLVRGKLNRRLFNTSLLSLTAIFVGIVISFLASPRIIDFILKPILLFTSGQLRETGSFALTFQALEWPETIPLLLFGAGQYLGTTDGWRYYGNTDIGYLRLLHVLGICGILILYGNIFRLSYQILHRFKKVNLPSYGWMWIAILVSGLLVDIKGHFTFNHYFLSFLFLFYFCSFKLVKDMQKDG